MEALENPLLRAAVGFVDSGKKVTGMLVDNHRDPRRVTFQFEGGSQETIQVNSRGLQQFMDWWGPTWHFLHLQVEPDHR